MGTVCRRESLMGVGGGGALGGHVREAMDETKGDCFLWQVVQWCGG